MKLQNSNQKGFTIIELLVSTVIIGVLAAIVITSITWAFDRAKQRATMADMRTIGTAIAAYAVDNNHVPSDARGLLALIENVAPVNGDVLPVRDHWGHLLVYTADAGTDYTLSSLGKDGLHGLLYEEDARFDFSRDLVLYNGVFTAAPE